jgi:hypothetical protein
LLRFSTGLLETGPRFVVDIVGKCQEQWQDGSENQQVQLHPD